MSYKPNTETWKKVCKNDHRAIPFLLDWYEKNGQPWDEEYCAERGITDEASFLVEVEKSLIDDVLHLGLTMTSKNGDMIANATGLPMNYMDPCIDYAPTFEFWVDFCGGDEQLAQDLLDWYEEYMGETWDDCADLPIWCDEELRDSLRDELPIVMQDMSEDLRERLVAVTGLQPEFDDEEE